jgi:hypothetical protein
LDTKNNNNTAIHAPYSKLQDNSIQSGRNNHSNSIIEKAGLQNFDAAFLENKKKYISEIRWTLSLI